MDRKELKEKLQVIFQDVFDDDELVIEEGMSADDVDGWDSLMHINLIIAVERILGVKFATAEISAMKADDQNIGTFMDMILGKLS